MAKYWNLQRLKSNRPKTDRELGTRAAPDIGRMEGTVSLR
jgi:hypothetical protein